MTSSVIKGSSRIDEGFPIPEITEKSYSPISKRVQRAVASSDVFKGLQEARVACLKRVYTKDYELYHAIRGEIESYPLHFAKTIGNVEDIKEIDSLLAKPFALVGGLASGFIGTVVAPLVIASLKRTCAYMDGHSALRKDQEHLEIVTDMRNMINRMCRDFAE